MGVVQLWNVLQGEGLVESLSGSVPEEHRRLVDEVDGKVLAVDLSVWIMQATAQTALFELFTPEEAAIKVCLERVSSRGGPSKMVLLAMAFSVDRSQSTPARRWLARRSRCSGCATAACQS
jgi:hypothetical protein